jgi:hypothetical protein
VALSQGRDSALAERGAAKYGKDPDLMRICEEAYRQHGRAIKQRCLGRGDFGADDLAENYEALKGAFGDSEQAASLLMDTAPLADELLDGLEELRKHKIDVDRMPLKKVKVRKR